MNFQTVEQSNGNKVTMFGVFTNVGGAEFSPQGKPKSKCKIRDDNGVEHTVHIYQGTGQLPMPQNLNQRYQFALSTFQGNYQGQLYTGYSGFWQSNAQVNQNTPQTPQQPAPQGKKEPDWDAIAQGKVRCNVLCGMLQGGISVDYSEVLRHTIFIMTGKAPSKDLQWQENPGDDNPPQPKDNDVPF